MPPAQPSRPVARRLVAALAAAAGLLALITPAAHAAGTPDIALDKRAPQTVLLGESARVTLEASSPAGEPRGYNLTFSDVLPVGVAYDGGATVAPTRVVTDAPGPGQTLLVWENVADLSGNSSFSIAYDVRPDPDAIPVGDSFVNQAAAYVNTDPREVPDVADTGVADAASFTGSATASATTTVTAVDIEKSEPSPEGELLRGVHDHATTYTLTIRNNLIRQSTNVRIADFLPAELEFLGCGGQDNTTDAPTNPGADVEYPGAPRLTAGTVLTSDCPTPGAVRTELTDPDAGGPLPGGVYTRADWQVPSLAPGQTLVIRYRAGIPIRENTLDWDGDGSPDLPAPAGSAPPTACDAGTGDCPQAANLDNNGGPETSEDGPGERPFTNLGRVLADFDVDGDPGTPDELVVDTDALTRFAEDLTVQKTVSPGTIAAGQLSAWTLVLRSGEYRTVDGLEVTDLVPDGLCPLGTSAPADAECQGGPGPSIPYSAAAEQAGGAWDLTWSTLPDLAASDELTLTYSTRTRAFYQQDFADERPVLNYDSWSNSVSLTGLDRVRLGSDGQPIDADEPGGINIIEDVDASSAGQSAPGPAIDKRVREPGGAVPVSCSTGAYIDTTAIAYGPGDRVCWELTATFPAGVFGRDVTITDFLPGGHEYEAGSAFQTGTSTAPVQSFSGSGELIEVVLGDPQGFVPAGRVFQGRFSSIVVDPEGDTGDVQGNLMKFSTTDSAGRTYPQRDRADVEYTEAALALVKGVRSVNGVPAGGNPPDTDGVSVAGGDVVTYRIDVTNTGGRDASAARVWDELPAQDTCADVSAISAGGTCNAAENRVEWTTGAITAGGSITLTYALTVPTTVAPAETLVNTAAVVSYTSATNRGGQFTYVPDNPTITDPGAGTPNAGPAEDGSSVTTPGGVVKTRTTTVDEPGNALAGQATIGERIRYTLEVSIAGGLTLTDGVLDDVVPAGQTVDPASATATLGGGPIPPTWTLSATASRVKLEAPSFANPPGAAVVLRVEFEVTLDDVPGNVRGGTATNRATLSFTNSLGQPVSRQSNQVSTRIVEPNLRVTKSEDDGNDQVVAGQVVRYTVDVVNSTTGASFVSPSHETRAVDTVPAGISPLEAPCPSAPCDVAEDGDVIPPNGGVWNATARTITWGLGTIDPAGTAQRVYDAVVDEPALAGATLRNEVVVTGTSLLGVIPGERTAASATNAGYRDDDDAVVTIEGITQIDKLTPRVRTVGQDTTYTVIVTIPGGVRFRDVHVRDVLPDGIRYDGFTSSSCAGCGGAAPDVSATGLPPQPQPGGTTVLGFWLGDIDPAPVGSERIVTITYAAHVKAQLTDGTPIVADDTLENTAQVRWNVTTDLPGTPTATPPTADVLGDSASATVSVIEPQIEVDKDIAPDTADLDARDAQPGETLSYTLRIRNTGNQTAYDVIVDDRPADELEDVVLAAGLTTDLNTDGWTAADPDLAWLIPSLSPGAAVTLTYTAKVKAGADLPPADPVVATNVLDVPSYFGLPLADRELDAREYGGTFGPVTPDQVDVTIRRPQLSLVKTTGLSGSPDTGDARIGEPFPWRVVVTNGATTASAFAVDVTDTLPDGWDYVAGSAELEGAPVGDPSGTPGPALTWTDLIATLPAGASRTLTFEATPTTAALDPDQRPVNPATNTAAASGEDSSGSGGYSAAPDTATATLRVPELTIAKTPDDGDAVAGRSFDWTVVVENTGDAPATDVIVRDVLPADVAYTANAASFVFAPATPEPVLTRLDESVSATDRELSWKLSALQPGQRATITIPVIPDAALANDAELENTAFAKATEQPGEVQDPGDVTVQRESDARITKAFAADTVIAGERATFTLTVDNAGPSVAANAVVTDTLPDGLLAAGATVEPGSPTCAFTGPALRCELGTLAPGDPPVTITVSAQVDPDRTEPISNTAEVTADDDTNPANDRGTDSVGVDEAANVGVRKSVDPGSILQGAQATYSIEVFNEGPSVARDVTLEDAIPAGLAIVSVAPGDPPCALSGRDLSCAFGDLAPGAAGDRTVTLVVRGDEPGTTTNTARVATTTPGNRPGDDEASAELVVRPVTDLAVVKSAPATVTAGGTFTYTLRVTNNGPATATAVTLSDPLPAGVTPLAARPGDACSISGQSVTCALGTLARGASRDVEIDARATFAVAGQTVVNVATVSGAETDLEPANNTDDAPTTVGPAADLAVTKTGPATAPAGGTILYSVAVVNKGPQAATGVVLDDVIPAGVTALEATPGQGGPCQVSAQSVRCPLGTLAAGASTQVLISARIAAGTTGTVVNVATVAGAEPDPTPADNRSEAPTRISGDLADQGDISVRKTLLTRSPQAGSPVDYRIDVRNDGTGTARDVVVVDTPQYPAQVVSVTPSQGTCTTTLPITCRLGSIRAGASARISVRVIPLVAGQFVNSAGGVAAGGDSNPDNNVGTSGGVTQTRRTTLTIRKTADRSVVRPGRQAWFTIRVRNTGRQTAENVKICDTPPPGTTFTAVPEGRIERGRACWREALLGRGKSVTHRVRIRLAPSTTATRVRNVATVTADNAATRRASRTLRVPRVPVAPRFTG